MKYSKMIGSAALISLMLILVALSAYPVRAQGTATVNILTALGGSTSPAAGTYTYPDGTNVTLTATPESSSYYFGYWEISTSSGINTTSNNPDSLTVSDSLNYTIEPVFIPYNEPAFVPSVPSPPSSSDAVVVVLAAVGGTTTPAPGTYLLASAATLDLTATPLSGWKFDNWVIGGYPLSHGAYAFTDTPTDNPYDVNHGYGYTYSYQPVFSLVSSSSSPTPTSTIPEYPTTALLALAIALIVVIAGSGVYAYERNGKRKQ